MKKQFLFYVMLLLPMVASAYDFSYQGIRYSFVSTTEQTVEVASSSQSAGSDGPSLYNGNVIIPSTVIYGGKEYTVVGIGQSAFVNCAGMTSISLPSTLTYIKKEAFNVCMGLKKITIPKNVESIGYDVFSVTSISEITVLNPIPASVSYNAFWYPQSNNNCVLYVPYGTSQAYKNTAEWNKFYSIVEMDKEPEMINGHEYIDLGLASGKLWAKTNLGAYSETQYGTYVQWSSNDIVTMNWGQDWGTPSYKDYVELINTCQWTWKTKDGVAGYEVTGPNGNSIFFPAAGFNMMGVSPQSVGSGIYYFTKDMSSEASFVYMLSGGSSSVTTYVTYNAEYVYAPIRPIVITMTSDVKNLEDEKSNSSIDIYNLNGTKKGQLQKGLNIIRMNNGRTKKIIMK